VLLAAFVVSLVHLWRLPGPQAIVEGDG
jgi:hypothetical protein